jgi:hypothetical protein
MRAENRLTIPTRRHWWRSLGTVAVVATSLCVAQPAMAAKRGSGGSTGGGSSTMKLVPLNSADGQPHFGQNVTFTVSTTATNAVNVALECWQNGVDVYDWAIGLYSWYPWAQLFILSSSYWTGGAADCTATASYASGKRQIQLATLSFHVYA